MHPIRFYVRKSASLLPLARTIRGIIMLGPLRAPLLSVCQKFSRSAALTMESDPSFTFVDVDKIVANIEDSGYSHIAHLPDDHLREIMEFCEQHDQISYWNPHQDCDAIDRIGRNAKLVEIARKYLGAEPRLWLTQLRWTFCPSSRPAVADKKSTNYDFHKFHYDCHDFKSLTIFIYLSDVTLDSGPHVFIRGTHKNKTVRELINIWISDSLAARLYSGKIHAVLGKRGTIFAVDTSCYHKAALCENANRLIASFDYVIRNKSRPVSFR